MILGRHELAIRALKSLRSRDVSEDEVVREIEAIERSVREEKEIAKDTSWVELFRSKDMVRRIPIPIQRIYLLMEN